MNTRERIRMLWHNIGHWWGGLPPYTEAQWLQYAALMRCGVLARRVFVLLATGSIYERNPALLVDTMTYWARLEDIEHPPVTEQEIAEAFAELRGAGLMDDAGRPLMLMDIIA